MAKKHPGFGSVQNKIAGKTNPRTGKPYGKETAGAILAARTRAASPSAKKANPRLKKVKGSAAVEMRPSLAAMEKEMRTILPGMHNFQAHSNSK